MAAIISITTFSEIISATVCHISDLLCWVGDGSVLLYWMAVFFLFFCFFAFLFPPSSRNHIRVLFPLLWNFRQFRNASLNLSPSPPLPYDIKGGGGGGGVVWSILQMVVLERVIGRRNKLCIQLNSWMCRPWMGRVLLEGTEWRGWVERDRQIDRDWWRASQHHSNRTASNRNPAAAAKCWENKGRRVRLDGVVCLSTDWPLVDSARQ